MNDSKRRVALNAVAAFMFFGASAAAGQNLVGFNFTTSGSTTPDPQNWNRVSAPDGTIMNVMDETGAASGVNITWGGGASGGFVYLATSTLATDAVPQYTYDLSGMTGYGFRSNGEFFINLTGLQANMPYEYWFVAYRSTAAIQNVVHVSDGDTIDAFTFTQSISTTDNNGRFLVNTTNANNTLHFNDLSFVTTSSSTGSITFNWAGDGQTTVIGALAIRLVPGPGALPLLAFAGLLPAIGRRRRA